MMRLLYFVKTWGMANKNCGPKSDSFSEVHFKAYMSKCCSAMKTAVRSFQEERRIYNKQYNGE
jgi:hypothetical protein